MTANNPSNKRRNQSFVWYSAAFILVVLPIILFLWNQPQNSPLPKNSAGKDSGKIALSNNIPKLSDRKEQKLRIASKSLTNKVNTNKEKTIIPDIIAENMQSPAGLVNGGGQKQDAVISFIATSSPGLQQSAAQDNPAVEAEEIDPEAENFIDDKTVSVEPLLSVEEKATFQGGDLRNFQKYVLENFKITESAQYIGASGKVIAQFVVGINGNIEEVKIIKGLNYPIDNEMIRVLQNSPPWKPAKLQGKAVRQKFIIPLSIDLHYEP